MRSVEQIFAEIRFLIWRQLLLFALVKQRTCSLIKNVRSSMMHADALISQRVENKSQ